MTRLALSLAFVVACGPGMPADDPGASSTPATTGTVVTTTAVPTTSATATDILGTSDTTGSTSTAGPTQLEWFGTLRYEADGAKFTPCDDPDQLTWNTDGLPAFASCTGEPLWIRLRGSLDHNIGTLFITDILEGPCLAGTCANGPSPQTCADFTALCIDYQPPCSMTAQDCPAGQKCGPIDGDSEHAACFPQGPDPAGPGAACHRVPFDTCDLTSMCHAIDPDTGEGTCAVLCIGPGMDGCADPELACPPSWLSVPVCEARCGNDLDCPPAHVCYPLYGHEALGLCVTFDGMNG